MAEQIHIFQSTTYNRPTFCDSCEKFLWGIVKQGYHCKCCGYNAHKKCYPHVEAPCIPVHMNPNYGSDTMSIHSGHNNSGASANTSIDLYYRSHSSSTSGTATPVNEHLTPPPAFGTSSATTNTTTTTTSSSHSSLSRNTFSIQDANDVSVSGRRSLDSELSRPRFYSESPSLMNNLMKSTAENAVNLEKEVKHSKAPLNLVTTTPKNLSRFVARVGPLVYIQELAIEVLTWQNPMKSMFAMLCYTVICLYPMLLVILPQMILIVVSLNNYYRKTKRLAMKKSKYNQNIQYLKNMQFIQNFMGQHVDIYDHVSENIKVLHWEDEQETFKIIKMALVSVFGVIVVVSLIPLNLLAMVVGLFLFIKNTPLFQAASTVLPPVVMHSVKENVEIIKSRLSFTTTTMRPSFIGGKSLGCSESSSGSGIQIYSEVFENQRWWSGLGWIPHLLRSERSAWTDEAGSTPRPSKDHMELPSKDWKWADKEWKLDVKWTRTDPEGWVYTDHLWRNAVEHSNMATLTRRRKWRRLMEKKIESPAEQQTSVNSEVKEKVA